jgi:predicted enzyme related to lactoylglutathione lyase
MTRPAAWIDITAAVAPWEAPGMGVMAVVLDPGGMRVGLWAPPT